MQNVRFGNTEHGSMRLGFGAMRLPTLKDGSVNFKLSTPMFKYAIEHGVNFLDSHHFYHNGQSEEAIGKAIESIPRNKIILQTKIGMYNNYTEENCWHLLENALKKMKTNYIDFYLSHSLKWQDYLKYNKLFLKFTKRAIDRGMVKYRGFSSHDTPENIKKLIETGEFYAMTVQYNLLDRKNEEVIALAHEKGMGVVVMGPVGGGTLGVPEEDILKWSPVKISNTATAELALKFVFANPNVHVALSGMSTMEQVKENLTTVSDTKQLSSEDIAKLDEVFETRKKLTELYCTGCQYCMPCPHKIKIPDIFRYYNNARIYGFNKIAKQGYLSLNPEERANMCQECGECESKCPQKISIQKKLKEVANYFGD